MENSQSNAFIFFIFLLQIYCTDSARFCVWQKAFAPHQSSQENPYLDQKSYPPHSLAEEVLKLLPPSQKFTDNITVLMNKTHQPFQSYHPHYMHSFSYPTPVSPHFYFGQSHGGGESFLFLVKDNETLHKVDFIRQMVKIKEEDHEVYDENIMKVSEKDLQFVMVVQNENMLGQEVKTSIILNNFGRYYGILTYQGGSFYKVFIAYFMKDESKLIGLDQISQQISIEVRNQTKLNNQNSWKNVKSFKWNHDKQTVRVDKNKPLSFEILMIKVSYKSSSLAKSIKLHLKEIKPASHDPSDIIHFLEKQIQIQGTHERPLLRKEKSQPQCEVEAESQLLSGLTYEFGTLVLMDRGKQIHNEPKQLLSFSPSRKRFPWGFLWDDGFHCEVAMRNNPSIAIEVLKSWLNTITESGWIPREQNRGKEREDLCSCPRFMAKDIRDANPPTLILSLLYLARKDLLTLELFPKEYYLKLVQWYSWFIKTQQSSDGSYIFKWHDSIQNEGSFNSGLDDFPRLPKTSGHIDCQSWMYLFATAMEKISKVYQGESSHYRADAQTIKYKLLQKFIDPKTNLPKDFSENLLLINHSPHFGYPSVLPIAFGILEKDSIAFNATLSAIEKELDSGHGLTSISMKSHEYLASHDAYWRGPVWVNINYLFLRGLSLHYPSEKSIYMKVRKDLIGTVCGNFEKNGYFYENYIEGKGSFSYPFTGWTALISIIVRENY